MAWWIYLGKVTTPIDIPGKGPTVLVPRHKFEAPMSSVAHLVRLKKVVALKPHQIPKPPEKVESKEPPVVPVVPAVEPKSEEKPKEVSSGSEKPVVTSSAVEEEPMVPVFDTDVDAVKVQEKSKVQQEKSKEGGRKKGSQRRRG
jgi:hypothetical protein